MSWPAIPFISVYSVVFPNQVNGGGICVGKVPLVMVVGGLETRLRAQELSFASTPSSVQFDTVGAQYVALLQQASPVHTFIEVVADGTVVVVSEAVMYGQKFYM